MDNEPGKKGMLYLVPTPIGNLEDMTMRAVRVLKEADLIAAEDTRNSRKILTHFDIHTPMVSYHEYNKYDKARELTDRMLAGTTVALITDAGTPGISDPGEELVKIAAEAGIRVSSLPGACALTTALTMSGLPTRRFCFEAFLPPRKKERMAVLEELKKETRTIVLYEAPHHLKETLGQLKEALGERDIVLLRELTKIHEEALRMTLSEAEAFYENTDPRGEYVVVIRGIDPEELEKESRRQWEEMDIPSHVQMYMQQGMDKKAAMKAAASDRGMSRREIYAMLLDEK